MNFDYITSLCEALSLEEDDRPTVILTEEHKRPEKVCLNCCLVGKILSSRVVNREAFKNVLCCVVYEGWTELLLLSLWVIISLSFIFLVRLTNGGSFSMVRSILIVHWLSWWIQKR